jgi:hypothetical protein
MTDAILRLLDGADSFAAIEFAARPGDAVAAVRTLDPRATQTIRARRDVHRQIDTARRVFACAKPLP